MWDSRPVRTLLVWHLHGSWTASFVAGRHRYLIPVNGDEDTYGHGLGGRDWPRAQEVPSSQLCDERVDLVVLQRPTSLNWRHVGWGAALASTFRPSMSNTTHRARFAVDSIHPFAGRDDIPLIHVTDFNCLMWNNGAAPTRVISHGIADPGRLYTGEIPAAATMINEPLRRWRTVGADLLDVLGSHAPIDVWGVDTEVLNGRNRTGRVRGKGDVPAPRLWHEVAGHRVYLHTARWTSLGMSLVEAMYLGMPIVAVASTMAPLVVPPEAGVVSADIKTLAYALEGFVTDFSAATAAGKAARDFAMAHFALETFLAEWDDVIEECCG
jgi:hypothetical protein